MHDSGISTETNRLILSVTLWALMLQIVVGRVGNEMLTNEAGEVTR
jgi:hypothetical protein